MHVQHDSSDRTLDAINVDYFLYKNINRVYERYFLIFATFFINKDVEKLIKTLILRS